VTKNLISISKEKRDLHVLNEMIMVKDMSGEEELVFVRRTSGLKKQITMRTAWAFSLAAAQMPWIWALIARMPDYYPGASMFITFLIAGIFTIFEGVGHGLLMVAMPRSGGNYVMVSRSLGPLFGAMEYVRNLFINPIGAGATAFTGVMAFSGQMVILGTVLQNPNLISLGSSLSNVYVIAVAALGLYAVTHVVDLLGPGWDAKLLAIFGGLAVLSLIAAGGVYATTPHNALPQAWDTTFGSGAYQEIVDKSTGLGFVSPTFDWTTQLTSIFIPITSCCWPYDIMIFAGEVQEPSKTIMFASLLGGFGTPLLWGGVTVFFQGAYGNFSTMVNMAFDSGTPLVLNTPFATNMGTFAAVLTTNPVISTFIALGPIFGVIGTLGPIYIAWNTRTQFAGAMDRLAPRPLAAVSKWGTPKYCILYNFIIGGISIALLTMGFWTFAAISWLISYAMIRWWWGLGETMLPWGRRKIFEASPIKWAIAGVPLIAICGVVVVFEFLYILFASAVITDIVSMIAIAGMYAFGCVWYQIFAARAATKGIDLSETFRELPPE